MSDSPDGAPVDGHGPEATEDEGSQRVGWFELFYDLVVVAAVAILGKVLIKTPDVQTTALVATALLVLFAIWLLTTISHGMFTWDDPIRRAAVLAQMALLSVAALSIGKQGLPNWIGFLAAAGAMLTIVFIFTRHRRMAGPAQEVNGLIVKLSMAAVIAFALSSVASVWLNSEQAAIVAPVILLIAAGIVLIPVITRLAALLASGQAVDPHHLQERFGLFVIIVLGESLIGLLAALAGKGTIPNPMYFALTFLVAFSIWSIYFNGILPFGVPSSVNRLRAWLACHVLLVLAIVVTAVEFADLTLNDAEYVQGVPQETWTVLPMLLTVAVISLLSFTLRSTWTLRGINLATLGVLSLLAIIETRMSGEDGNWFVFLGAVLLMADGVACSIASYRRSGVRSQPSGA